MKTKLEQIKNKIKHYGPAVFAGASIATVIAVIITRNGDEGWMNLIIDEEGLKQLAEDKNATIPFPTAKVLLTSRPFTGEDI